MLLKNYHTPNYVKLEVCGEQSPHGMALRQNSASKHVLDQFWVIPCQYQYEKTHVYNVNIGPI